MKTCGKDELVDNLDKYEDFKREDGQSFINYINMFDFKYRRIERKYIKFTPEVLIFRLLKKANITRSEKLLFLNRRN